MIKSHTKRRSRRLLVLTPIALASVTLALLASGCGGSDESAAVAAADPTAQTTEAEGAAVDEKDPEQALLEFAQCMRDNGIPDFPDPVANADGSFRIGQPPADADFQAWNRVAGGPCSERLADAGLVLGGGQSQDDASQAERLDAELAFAKCMRGEGVNVPDPDPNSPLGGLHSLDQQSPTVQAAFSKCQPLLADAFGHGG